MSSDPTAIPATPPEAAPAPRKKQPLRAASSIPTLDLICRVGLIALLRRGDISHMLFWAINIVLLLSFAIFSGVRVTRAEKRLGLSSTESVPEPDGVAVLLLLGLCIFGVVAGWTATFESMFWRVLFSAICGLVAFGYGGLLYACNPHLPASSEGEMQFGEDWLDENDRVLVDLETQKTSIFQRVDTYTLESTLLGAISFSAYVTIVSGVNQLRNLVQTLSSHLAELARRCSAWDLIGAIDSISTFDGDELLLAIAVLSLICSMCFLCVIVARLRFTSALSHTDFCIRFAAALNSKEDDVHNLKLTVAPEHQDAIIRRLETIRLPMNDALRTAAKALAMLRPLLAYMAIFRNLGIISFLVTLITSALWFSKPLAGAFAVLSLVAYAYPLIDSVRDRAMRRLDIFQRAQALLSKLHPLAVHRPSVR